jgi:hypothetical protein
MRLAVRVLSVFCLAALLGTVQADEKKPDKKPPDKKDPNVAVFAFPKQIKLDEKQQAKVEDLKKEYTPKLNELNDKLAKILTPERVKAASEARKAAATDGKNKKEQGQAYEDALKLNDDEKAQRKEIEQARKKLQGEIRTKKLDLLTDEQKEAIKPKPKDKKPADK